MKVHPAFRFSMTLVFLMHSGMSNAASTYGKSHDQVYGSGPNNQSAPLSESSASRSSVQFLVDNINPSDQAGCMKGEKFTQTIQGNSHTRSVSAMPPGYFYGMMLSFAQNKCLAKKSQNGSSTDMVSAPSPLLLNSFEGTLARPAGAYPGRDSLTHFGREPELSATKDPLIQNYSLLLPLGMIESSGQFNEGRDMSASNTSGSTAEAGMFQVSYNSVNGNQVPTAIYRQLMQKYNYGNDSARCMVSVFSQGVKLSRNTSTAGGGEGQQFQEAMKKCPALAVDYMAVLSRNDYRHNGPLLRREAQPRQACVNALTQVSAQIDSGTGDSICNSLATMSPSDFDASSYQARMGQIGGEVGRSIDRGQMSYDPNTGSVAWQNGGATKNYELGDDRDNADAKAELTQQSNVDLYDRLNRSAQGLDDRAANLEARANALEKDGKPEEAKALRDEASAARDEAKELRAQMSSVPLIKAKIQKLEGDITRLDKNISALRTEAEAIPYNLRNEASDAAVKIKLDEAKRLEGEVAKSKAELEKQRQLVNELEAKAKAAEQAKPAPKSGP